MALLDFLTETLAIDPGTHTFRISKGDKVIFNEPTRITFEKNTSKVTGFGNSAQVMDQHIVSNPVSYSIADFQAFEMFQRNAFRKAVPVKPFALRNYKLYYCIPPNSTEVDRRAYRDSAEFSGAKEVSMIYQSYAAAIGMNILHGKRDFILIDFGASKVEISIFADSLVIAQGLIRLGTWKLFQVIRNFFFRNHKITLTDSETEEILRSIKRNDTVTDLTIRHTTIDLNVLDGLLNNYFMIIRDEIVATMEHAGRHHSIEKILINGIYFTGGGAAIDGLFDRVVPDERIPCHRSQWPLLDNSHGLMKVMAEREKFKDYIFV